MQLLRGKELDAIALKLGLIRRRKWFIFKESNSSLRSRVESRVNMICQGTLSVIGCTLL